jgi:predicted ATP-binding protein involved in virulence
MRIKKLYLKNIGPFDEASLDFNPNTDITFETHNEEWVTRKSGDPKVTIITGENGTGKTIILDAIRGILLGSYGQIERNITRKEEEFLIEGEFTIPRKGIPFFKFDPDTKVRSSKLSDKKKFDTNGDNINRKFRLNNKSFDPWVVNYWTSKLATDSFELKNLVAPKPENYLNTSLNGIQPNLEVTQLICFFDYLKSSENPKEKQRGEFLFELLKKIIKLSLLDGEFRYVERQTLTPIIYQTGQEISLDKLSSGNLYLIQRMVSLLGQMYSVHILNNTSIENICDAPGLLLIDEAENHLHPKWQKTFLNSVLEIFPNLQIIVTTHSPFIVSSVKNAKVFVCKSKGDHSVVEDETEAYSNMSVEEILLSPVFNTSGFSEQITQLIQDRKTAIENGNKQKADKIEKQLKQLNPEYFSYFDVEDILQEISK